MKSLNENIYDRLPEGVERLRSIFKAILANPETNLCSIDNIKREIFEGVLDYSGIDVSKLSEKEKTELTALLRNSLAYIFIEAICENQQQRISELHEKKGYKKVVIH